MKKDLKKPVTLIMVFALCVTMFTGCKSKTDTQTDDTQAGGTAQTAGSEEKTADSNKEPVNITWYESTDNEAYTKAIADAFNSSQSDVHCEVVLIPQDDYETKTKAMLAGGSGDIDVLHVSGVALANSYGYNQVTLDLADYLKNTDLDLDNFGGKIEYSTLDNGYVAAMPEGWGGWFLFYNKAAFDEAGISYPDQLTWDQYADLAKSLTSQKDGVQKWGGYYPAWTLNLYALQHDSYLADDDITYTKEALEFLNRIYNVDKSHMGLAEMTATSSDPIAMFESGDVAMMIDGAWALGQLKADEDKGISNVQWSMTNLPVPDGVTPKTGVGGISFVGINANSKHKDESWKFVNFLVGPEGAKIYASYGNLPAYVTEEIGQYYLDFYKYDFASLLFDPDLKINAEQGKDPNYADILDVFQQNAQLYLLGDATIDEFADGFVSDRENAAAK